MKKIIVFAYVFLLGLMVIMFSQVVAANAKTYEIGVEDIEYFPQYSYENGQYIGFGREVLDLFAKSKGYTFIYKPLPVKRLFADFLSEKVDFKYPDSPNWSKSLKEGKNIVYSESVVKSFEGVMVLPANKGKGLENLKTLGTMIGFTTYGYTNYIEKGQIRLVENTSFLASINQVIYGRVNGVYMEMSVAAFYLREKLKTPDALVFDQELPYSEISFLLSTIKHPQVIAEFNQFLKDNKAKIEELKKKYQIK